MALLVAVTPIYATEPFDQNDIIGLITEDGIERFELWNACQPVKLLVKPLPNDFDMKRGLTREAIAVAARSRLRAARLYLDLEGGPAKAMLYVNVNLVDGGRLFTVRVELWKYLLDLVSGEYSFDTTWYTGVTGQFPQDAAGSILSQVSRLTDKFIDEYLRVNEPACSHSPIDP